MNERFIRRIAADKKDVEKELKRLFSGSRNRYEKPLYERMYYSVSAGGKRIRPSIILNVGRSLSGKADASKFMPAACSVEMIHTYSLIHDDLPSMDNDDFRRGRPTLHKKYNESSAILAGDALFSYAIEVFLQSSFKSGNVLAALDFLLKSVGPEGMVAGQFADTEISLFIRDINTLKYIHRKKTANLLAACFSLPSILMGKSSKATDLYTDIGMSMGLLFQIVDDILDVKSDSKTLGKTAGKDAEQNKLTYTTFYGTEKAMKTARSEAEKIRRKIRSAGKDSGYLEDLLDYFITRIN